MTTTDTWPVSASERRTARAMTRAERRAYLRERGWSRLSRHGAETWRVPDPEDGGFYTLAAATYRAVARARAAG